MAKGEELFGYAGEDIITGFRGTIIGYCSYSTGCNQYLLAPRVSENGDKVEAEWIDEQRVQVRTDLTRVVIDNGSSVGGDRSPARR